MRANDTQVGGSHYEADFQHWDLISDLYGPGYLIGCATKYLTRWRKKNGRQDLDKACHYLQKLSELVDEGQVHLYGLGAENRVEEFAQANQLNAAERLILKWIFQATDASHLRMAISGIDILLGQEE